MSYRLLGFMYSVPSHSKFDTTSFPPDLEQMAMALSLVEHQMK